ncbi:MAG TPA: hypothetical protein PKG78_00385 [Candidatus Woesebacteria bacterium]|jgi:hypothetical protein|nr:hypothetical protein [Candidatus Woesebacteria bacterium]
MTLGINHSKKSDLLMPKAKNKKATKKAKSTPQSESLLKKEIFSEQQAAFYKKHPHAKTLISILILLFLVLMSLYLNEYGNAWISELRLFFVSQGATQAAF